MIRTILVDDHAMFCDGLDRVLTETHKFYIVSKFNSGNRFLESVIDQTTNLVIIDIEMHGLSGFEVVKRLRLKNMNLKIVMLSMHGETVYSNEACAIGADAYLVKTLESSSLVELLLKICQGEKIFLTSSHSREKNNLLSDREIEVLKLLVKGKTSEQIGLCLSISPLTIKVHRRNMMKKLNAANSVELISKALERGIL